MTVTSNKELVLRMIEEVFNGGRPDRLGAYWDPAMVGEAEGLHRKLTDAFGDLHVAVDDVVAEGDRVVVRLTFSGTHDGPFHGLPPTGRAVRFGAIRIYRVADGTLVETWAHQDAMGLMAQIRGT
ncbi:hypothetical protein Acsp06_27010 [Actinomycetospora sp. NBRC 106375]|uniref:ester cyclase n=1 Tax=Actinomycetospora sp. NBRC 106375 TaxID=3032207 RepID=UPI0024A53927|nr:ester cyclase [Actinomycetospora sp. NBRC 106375]GLZ46516.1 hypothetical protein Acsp06_27010 [Actinomycetospora sp. NBRC 106375]